MKVKVEITETLKRIVEVDAESVAEGVGKVALEYGAGNIILDENHYNGCTIKEYKGT